MKELLKKLVEAPGVSGYENSIRDIMEKELKKTCDSVEVNKIGNLIAKKGNGKGKILLMAHMDEIGLMVKNITEKGFIRFAPVGGWDQKVLPAQKIRIYANNSVITGVIGSKPIHLQEKEELEKIIKLKELYIDVGAKNKKDVEKIGIKIGDFIGLYGEFSELKNNLVTGYGLDDRAGCAALIEIMKQKKPKDFTIYAVGTVQEERGLIGARGVGFQINPNIAIAIDTTIACDTPDAGEESGIKIGHGPVLNIMDYSSVIHPTIKNWLETVAEKNKIKYQRDVLIEGGMDSSLMSIVREGIPAAGICVPARYIHTPTEVLSLDDLENLVKLVVAALKDTKEIKKLL